MSVRLFFLRLENAMKICYDYTVMGFVPKHIADEAKEVAYRELGYQLVKMAL